MTTGFGVIENDANVKIGESVVVFGAGGIGLNMIQAASLHSAWPIIAVDQFEGRLNLAREMGASHCINSNNGETESTIKRDLGGDRVDVFIDNTGNPSIIELGYRLTHSNGRVVLVGVPKQGKTVNLSTLPLHFGKQLIGSHGGNSHPQFDIPRYLKLQSRGQLKLQKLVSAHYSLDQINEAITAMRDGQTAGRVMIRF